MAYRPMPFGSGLFLFLTGSRLAEEAPETGLRVRKRISSGILPGKQGVLREVIFLRTLSTFPWRTCSQLLRRYVF
jgi:hypothetical protein